MALLCRFFVADSVLFGLVDGRLWQYWKLASVFPAIIFIAL